MIIPLIITSSAFSISATEDVSFVDVTGKDWFYNSVRQIYTLGIMNGVSDTEFAPDANMSRAMAVTVIYRSSDRQFSGKSSGFADVSEGKWYSSAVNWAYEKGVVKGRTETTFVPDGKVTRGEFAVMLDRFDGTQEKQIAEKKDGDLADMDKIPSYAKASVVRMFRAGIINGRPGGVFDADDYVTRAEAAAMLNRYCEARLDLIRAETEKEDYTVEIQNSNIYPDFDLAVSISDAIVKGEVIEEYESGHSNPTDVEVNALGETIPFGIVTKYSFRVDEVYKGDLNPGDVISLETAYDTGLRAADYDKYNVILAGTPFGLTAGQSGIFLLAKDEVWTSPASGDFYAVVHNEWGVLEGPDSEGYYSSAVYKATPASFASGKEDIIVDIQNSNIYPDFDLAVSISDAIVKGEVIEEYEPCHSNPTGKALNAIGETIPYGIVTKYSFRVDEVYKGDLKPSDVISLETVLDTGIPDADYEKYNVILDGTPFELTAGQSGIFLIAKDEIWTEPASGDFYVVVHGEWGFLKGPDSDGFYSSAVYKATPASLIEMVK